jgi:hypothetical protein
MSSLRPSLVRARTLAIALTIACVSIAHAAKPSPSLATLGVDVSSLSQVVDNPYAPFSRIARAVYAGYDLDDDTKDTLQTRVVMTVREAPEKVAGTMATVVEFVHLEQGAVVEKSWKYYAQDPSGAVFALGDKVDDIEADKVVSHVGQWVAGEKRARAGLHMPAAPALGGLFEQGLAPGAFESRSRVMKLATTWTVPAGTFEDCLETDVLDPVSKARSSRVYAKGRGLVREQSSMHLLELVELELRTPPPQSGTK